MKQFKPGDHVHGTAGHGHLFTGPDLLDAIVLETWEDGQVLIKIVTHRLYPHEAGAMLGVDENEIERIEEKGATPI